MLALVRELTLYPAEVACFGVPEEPDGLRLFHSERLKLKRPTANAVGREISS